MANVSTPPPSSLSSGNDAIANGYIFMPAEKKKREPLPSIAAWEYEERTIHGHFGWVPMAPDFSDQLEELYAIQPCDVIRIQKSEDPSVVWEIDIGKRT